MSYVWISAVIFVVIAEAAIWPWKKCPVCEGVKPASPFSASWRECGSCKGRGKRLRVIARIVRPDLR